MYYLKKIGVLVWQLHLNIFLIWKVCIDFSYDLAWNCTNVSTLIGINGSALIQEEAKGDPYHIQIYIFDIEKCVSTISMTLHETAQTFLLW